MYHAYISFLKKIVNILFLPWTFQYLKEIIKLHESSIIISNRKCFHDYLLTSISESQQAIIIVIQEIIRIIFSSWFQVVLNWFLRKIAFILLLKEKCRSPCDKRKQISLTVLKTLEKKIFHSFIKYHIRNRV